MFCSMTAIICLIWAVIILLSGGLLESLVLFGAAYVFLRLSVTEAHIDGLPGHPDDDDY